MTQRITIPDRAQGRKSTSLFEASTAGQRQTARGMPNEGTTVTNRGEDKGPDVAVVAVSDPS